MRRMSRFARPLVMVALLLSVFAPAQPAAQAAVMAVATQEPPPPPGAPSGGSPSFFPAQLPTCSFNENSASKLDGQLIHDFATITSTFTMPDTGSNLWDVAVQTVITHTYPNDLDIHLVSPAGTIVTLSNHNGGGNPGNVFSGTAWLDQAGLINGSGLPVTDYHFTPGTPARYLNPQEPLSALQGQPTAGKWSLVVHDGAAGDGGQLVGWALTLASLRASPHITTTTQFSDNSVQPITNTGTVTRSINVAGLDNTIAGLTVTTFITHAIPGSLNVFLISPDGITITLSTLNGGANNNVFAGTVWDDAAGLSNPPGSVTENTFAPNVVESPLAPEEALNELDGHIANGTWRLVVQDTISDTHTGLLGPVKISLRTVKCPPDLSASIFTPAAAPRVGRQLPITFRAANLGDFATNINLTSTLPAQLKYQSFNAPGWSCLTPPPGSAGGNVLCSRPNLGANTHADVVISVTAPALPTDDVPVSMTLGLAPTEVITPNNTAHRTISFFVHSANGNPWDVYTGDGSMNDGGQDAFDTWGQVRMVVLDNNGVQIDDQNPSGFGLVYGPGHRWTTTTPFVMDNIGVSRSLFGPAGADWMRYVDTFHNTGGVSETVILAWGGNLGSDQSTVTAATSSGDKVLAANDRWAVTEQQDTPGGPAVDAVLGYAFRSAADTRYLGPTDISNVDITTPWPSTGNDNLAHTFKFKLKPSDTARLAYFVYRGLSEYDPGPQDCAVYGGCVTPANGAQVALVTNAVTALQANPYFCDLSPSERASLVNWPGIVDHCDFLPIAER